MPIAQLQSTINSNHSWKDIRKLHKDLIRLVNNQPAIKDKKLVQLKLSNKCRLFGFYDGSVFNIMFLDINHEWYEVTKKHT